MVKPGSEGDLFFTNPFQSNGFQEVQTERSSVSLYQRRAVQESELKMRRREGRSLRDSERRGDYDKDDAFLLPSFQDKEDEYSKVDCMQERARNE